METDRLKLKKATQEGLGKVGQMKGGRILTERISAAHAEGQPPTKIVKDPKVQNTIKNMTKWNTGK